MAVAEATRFRVPLDPSRASGALDRLVGLGVEPALLESGPGFGAAGRWSIAAAGPRLVFEAIGEDWSVRPGPAARAAGFNPESGRGGPLEALGRLLDRLGLAATVEPSCLGAPPFGGGLIGFLGFDLAPRLERLPRKAPRDSRLPDIRFGLYDSGLTFDRATGVVEAWAANLLGLGPRATRRRLDGLIALLSEPDPPTPRPARLGPLASNFGRDDYLDAVRRALEYIAAGDVFQVNLSQRFEARGRFDPLDLYRRLRARSPSPFAAFLRWDDLAVAGASPEWFYQVRGDRIITRPIKGTRPRGSNPEEDARLASELLASPKDRAELTMIVDLERNDLGRVCRFGTVRVTDPLVIESFAQVHHLVATVEGRLRPDAGPIEVVRAIFPGGSITGAPKIRAMEIIDELEPTRRSLYTGAIGYFGRGTSAFNIAIRTLLMEGDRVRYQVGGGIVADSDPEAEFEETLHKGRALREVIEGWGIEP